MISWFAKNSVAANLLMVSIFLGGFFALQNRIPLEVFPSADPDTISISVPLRGATPEDVELGVAVRIEEAVQDLEGIDKITSRSIEGSTSIAIEIDSDYDPRELLNDIKSRVDAINTFPADTEKPVISLATRRFDVIDVVVSGNFTEDEIRLFAEQVRDDLLRIEGITQAELDSVRNYEIAIEASQDRLREFEVTLADVANAIRGSSNDLSAGNVRTEGGDVLIRSKGQAYQRQEFESIVVKTNADGSIIRVGDIANVRDSFEEESVITRFNGEPAAFIGVSRVGNQSAIKVADKVKDYIEAEQSSLPQGMTLDYWDDDSQILKKRLGILTKSALQGGILVILLLTMFLRPSVAFWVFLGIPISFAGALISMSLFNISLNVMSAFGFIIVLGIVVDDAIVTGENVYSHIRRYGGGVDAAISGTKEVAVPVTFGVLTTMVAFTPLAFIEGRLGTIFAPIAAVVIPCLFFSLVESKLILPAHLKHVRLSKRSSWMAGFQRWQQKFADGFEAAIVKYYRPLLERALHHRYSTLAAFVGVLIIMITMITSGWTRFVFVPPIESETARSTLIMPVGTPFELTDYHIQRMTDAARALKEKYRDEETGQSVILNILASTGTSGRQNGSNLGRVRFEIIPPEMRSSTVTMSELVSEWRKMIGPVAGAESLSFRASIFRAGDPINVQFSGVSLERLTAIGEEIKNYLTTVPGVFEISDSLSDGKEEIRIELKSEGYVLGLTRTDVLQQVSQAFKGFEAQRIQRGRDDIRVIVRLPKAERSTLATLSELQITAPDGRRVPLSNVATLAPGKGPSQITRIDRYRVLNVTAEVDKDNTNMTVLQSELNDFVQQTLAKYPSISYELEGEAREQAKSFGSLKVGLIIVLFAIFCLLALPLKSYTQPLIVMSVIPFGIIGAVIGHWIMGQPISILSLLGVMALIGVVINDSLVLVDFINQKHRGGEKLIDAIREAGVVRFRPVMLTSLTTFFGLSPLLLEKSTTAQFLIPMAISLGFGILFATMITLVLVPTNVLIASDIGRFLRGDRADKEQEQATS